MKTKTESLIARKAAKAAKKGKKGIIVLNQDVRWFLCGFAQK